MHNDDKRQSDIALPQLPFLTREMLKFGSKSILQLTVTSHSTKQVRLRVHTLDRSGHSEFEHLTSGALTEQSQTFGIADIPIMVMVENAASADLQGDAYVIVHLTIDGERKYQLCSGFVYQRKSISWPATFQQDMRPNGGQIITLASGVPAAGAEITHTVPDGFLWRLLNMSLVLVTDANASSRRVHFVFTRSDGTLIDTFPETDTPANTTRLYCVSRTGYLDSRTSNDVIPVALPADIWLDNGSTITTETVGIQAGDAFAALQALVERWPAGN